MARLYWNFVTNVERKNKELFVPQLDELIFKTTNGDYLFVSCGFESGYGIEDGVHNGEWKGLEYRLEDSEGHDLMEDWCEEDNTQEFKELLTGAVPVAFYIDEDDLSEHGYDQSFTPTCEKVDIDIDVMGVNFSYTADSLMEEGQWLDQLKAEREAAERKAKEEHENLKDIWLNGAEPGGYSNSHVSVQMFIKDFTDADKEHFEDLILQDQERRRLFGGFEGAFYADINDHGTYKELSFDLHKGDFEAAKRLSKIYPDAVVFVNDDWDIHSFAVFKDGEHYDDYTAAFEGDEPEPYEEDGETYYDIDVEIDIKLPFSDQMHTCYSGGGMCTENEFKMYKEQVEERARERETIEREDI